MTTFRAALAACLFASASPVYAAVDDHTSCAVLNKLMASQSPDMAQVGEFKALILDTMTELDSSHTENGEPGIMSQLSDGGRNGMAAAASVWCKDHPKETVRNSAAFTYVSIRDLEVGLGAAK